MLWRWHHQDAWVSGRQHFRGFCGKGFPADSRYSNGSKLCPSSSRYISLLIWSRIYTVFALNREETVGVSVQFHIQVHRWCFVHKQQVWELPGPYVSRWTRDQRHDREQNFCFIPGFTSVDRDGQLHSSIYDKRDDFNFHITNFPFLSSNIPTSPAYGVFISQLILYARACSSYGCFILRATRLSNNLLEQGYVKERLKSSLRKFYGRYGDLIRQYEVSLSQMLNDILWPDHIQWQPPTDQTLYRTRPFTEFWVVSIEHLRRVWHADRIRLLLRTPGPVPFGICKCSFVETVDTQSYITQPIHDPFPELTSYRTWLLSLNWHHQIMTFSLIWLLTEFDFTEYRLTWNICNGCGMLIGDAYSSGHLVPSLWDLHMYMYYLLRPILYRTCRYFTGLCSSNIHRYFLDFAHFSLASAS